MSTNPGVTRAPSASMTRRARPSTLPTSVTTPSLMATSAVRPGDPVPSMTVPALITRSCIRIRYAIVAQTITLEVDGPVAVITNNNPDKHNAFDDEMDGRLFDILGELRARK